MMKEFKKGLIGLVAFAMIFASVAAAMPASAAVADGSLVKTADSSTVYYVSGGKLYVFPNEKTYATWFSNWDGVMTVTQAELTALNGGVPAGNVTYREGTKLVTTPSVSTVYAVEPGGVLRSILSEENAIALYGSNWASRVEDVPAGFMVNYTVGSDMTPGVYPVGTLVREDGASTTYIVGEGATKRPIATGEAFDANMWSWGNLVTASDLSGYADGTSVTGAEAGFTTVAGTSGSSTTPSADSVNVSLSASTPAATTVISDTGNGAQALVPMVTVNFTAPSTGDVTVNTLKFKRTGISSDTDVEASYVYEGMTKLAEGGSLSSGYVTFNKSTGLFTVPAGTTKSVTLRVDLKEALSAGKTLSFQLEEVMTENSAAVNGSLPIAGNTMSTASVTDLGYASYGLTGGGYTLASANGTVDPGEDDFKVYQMQLQANDQDLELHYLKATLLGSVEQDDLRNFTLKKGGDVLATGELNGDREVEFDLMASPYEIEKGENPTLEIHADVVSGTDRTFRFKVEYATDIVLKDQGYGVYVGDTAEWSAKGNAYYYTINTGSLTVSRDTGSPSENVVAGANNVKLGTFTFEANGEDVKVKNLAVKATVTGSRGTVAGLDNGKVFLNGVQVGTTQDIVTASAGTSFTFGSSFIVPAGEVSMVDIYADVKTSTSTDYASDDTVKVEFVAGTDNAQGVNSLTSISSSNVAGNALTVSASSLNLIKYSAYGNQSIVKPANAAKIASFVVSAGAYEGIDIDSFTLTNATSGPMQNLKFVDSESGTQYGTTKSSLPSSGSSTVTVNNLDLAASESRVIDVFADIKSTTTANTIAISVAAAGTAAVTGDSTSASAAALQTMTITTGSISAAADGSKPDADIVVAGNTVTMNVVKFTAVNEAYEVTKMQIDNSSATADRSVGKVILEYENEAGDTMTAEGYLSSGTVNFNGLTVYVPKDETALVTVKAMVPTVSQGAVSGDLPALTFDGSANFSAKGLASGTVTTSNPGSVSANSMVVRKTVPTVTTVTLPSTTLSNGTKVISKFSVAADSAGAVYFKEMNFTYTTSSGIALGDVKLYRTGNSTALCTATVDTVNKTIECVLSSEEQIGAGESKTYELKAMSVTGTTDNSSITTTIAGSASAATAGTSTTYDLLKLYETGGLLWSDGSTTPHTSSSADYADATYVNNLPTDSQNLTK